MAVISLLEIAQKRKACNKEGKPFRKQGKSPEKALEFNSADPNDWAIGLQKCGYATDPHYAEKLIKTMKLWLLH